MSKGWGTWFRVMRATWAEDGSAAVVPVGEPKAARQWAHEDLLRRFRAGEGEGLVIVETDDRPSWEYGSYGQEPGNEEMAAAMKVRGWGG